ncbi:MAG: tRNA (N(6)-L-threonylcarbamoyladenosine(37)-C(2))-methylthiotransferase MtaB [Spirochaetia bacterium]
MNIRFFTFGCKLNQVESESIASGFAQSGFTVDTGLGTGDLFIINTCTVTSRSEQKARRIIRKLLRENPGALVIVTGCYAQLEKEELGKLGDRVVVLGMEEKAKIQELAGFLEHTSGVDFEAAVHQWAASLHSSQEPGTGRFDYQPKSFSFHSRAFLKVQDGCNNRCAYCRVPLARGNSVSLSASEAVERAKTLEQEGYRELVITGVNISSYNSNGTDLAGLVRQMLKHTSGFRIRLSSLEPDTITDQLIETCMDDRICPHFHIPIQSGSDSVLQAMGRKYSISGALAIVEKLKKKVPAPFLAADIIAGLPGETEEDFRCSQDLLTQGVFHHAHVFSFSPRPGTVLYQAKNRVPERIIKERAAILQQESENRTRKFLDTLIGKTVNVLVEKVKTVGGNCVAEGYSGQYARIEAAAQKGVLHPGRIYQAEIQKRNQTKLEGSIH